jgi:MFS family permease
MQVGGEGPDLAGKRLPGAVRLLVVASFVVAVGYGIIAPALPAFARSFDVGVAAASAVISAFAVFRLVFAPLSGRLVGRLGELRVFCGGLAIVAASSAACAFAGSYAQLLIFRAVGGIGSTMFTVSAAVLLIRITPPTLRGRANAAWAAGFLLGTVAGPLVGAGVAVVGLRVPFLVYAVLLLVAIGVAGLFLREPSVAPHDPDRTGADATPFRYAMRHPTFRAALASNFVHGSTVYGVRIALVPLLVTDVLSRPGGWSGVALAVTAAGTAAVLQPSGRLSDHRGRRLPAMVGLAVTTTAMLGLGFTMSWPALLAVSLLAGVGTGLTGPPTNAAVADVLADGEGAAPSGSALAGFQMAGDVGAIFGPVLAGLLVDLGGYPAAFAATAAISAIAFGTWVRAPETRPPVPDPPARR